MAHTQTRMELPVIWAHEVDTPVGVDCDIVLRWWKSSRFVFCIFWVCFMAVRDWVWVLILLGCLVM